MNHDSCNDHSDENGCQKNSIEKQCLRDDCAAMQSLLFEFDDAELNQPQLEAVSEHLADCEYCRRQLEDERALTALLTSKPAVRVQKTAPAGVALQQKSFWAVTALTASLLVVGGLALFFLVKPSPAYGSIVSRHLFSQQAADDQPKQLAAANHIDVPAGASATIRLKDIGKIELVGPAVLELDRVDSQWKLTLIKGQISIDVHENRHVIVAAKNGVKRLHSGAHIVSATGDSTQSENRGAVAKTPAAADRNARGDDRPPAALMDDAFGAFHSLLHASESEGANRMAESARLLELAIKHPDITAEQKSQARFYLAAALSNTGRHQKALEVAQIWLRDNPDESSDTMMSIIGDAYAAMGQREEAAKIWKQMLRENPNSPYKPHIEKQLADPPKKDDPANTDASRELSTAAPAVQTKPGPYLVVAVALDVDDATDQRFVKVAEDAAEFHKGSLIHFDGSNFEELARILKQHQPQNVLFVISPNVLDVNFHRQVLLLSPKLDSDPFVDFAFGYLTAESADDLEALWQRILGLHAKGWHQRHWVESAVVGGGIDRSYNTDSRSLSAQAQAAGLKARVCISPSLTRMSKNLSTRSCNDSKTPRSLA